MVIEQMQVDLRRIFDPNPRLVRWGSYCAAHYDWEIDYRQGGDDAEAYRKYLQKELDEAVYNEKIPFHYVTSINGELNRITMMWKEFFYQEFRDPYEDVEF